MQTTERDRGRSCCGVRSQRVGGGSQTPWLTQLRWQRPEDTGQHRPRPSPLTRGGAGRLGGQEPGWDPCIRDAWPAGEPSGEAQCGRRAHFPSQQASSSLLQVGIWRGPQGPFRLTAGGGGDPGERILLRGKSKTKRNPNSTEQGVRRSAKLRGISATSPGRLKGGPKWTPKQVQPAGSPPPPRSGPGLRFCWMR